MSTHGDPAFDPHELGWEQSLQLRQLQAILETAVDAIVTIDMYGVIEAVNPATERMFGYTSDELIGNNISMLMPSPYREQHDEYLARYVLTGQRKIIGVGREVVGLRRDGSEFPMHLAVSELGVGDRRLFTGIVRDISDLKEAEGRLAELNAELEQRVQERSEQLREAQATLLRQEKLATLGQVSGGIAHEIRNPLNAVKTSAYFLLHAKSASPEKIAEHLQRIDRQVTLIDNVVTALSDVAKLPDPIPSRIEPRRCLENVLRTVGLPSSIDVQLEMADDLPRLLADENQIHIVFRNVIRNARDAMPDGGQLRLKATVRDDRVGISVIDNGIGIAPADLERVLEPLYSTKARGMGLGLAICRVILEKNKGELRVSSQLGQGSEFQIWLRSADGQVVEVSFDADDRPAS